MADESLFVPLIVTWLALCAVVGWYASSKGRSGAGFFFVAALLSPIIGFVIALTVQPIRANTDAKAVGSGEFKKCPFCAELIRSEATVCRYCNRDLANALRSTFEQAHDANTLASLFASGQTISTEQFQTIVAGAESSPSLVQTTNKLNGDTLLHFAAKNNLFREAEALVNAGASLEEGNGSGRKPYQVAANPKLGRLLYNLRP